MPYFVVRIAGGLGNQLFQYCFARSLALRRNLKIFLDISYYSHGFRRYLLPEFNTIQQIVSPEKLKQLLKWRNIFYFRVINKLLPARQKKYYREQVGPMGIDEHVDRLTGIKYLEGYWQHKNYFQSVWGEIKRELQLKQKGATCIAWQKKIASHASVSIHIRRGDYVTNARIREQHGYCSQEYYDRAVCEMTQRVNQPVFFIFSDDVAWVQKNFIMHYPCEIVSSNDLTECEELFLMSACKHNIIANSTYSWWGAWMNEHDKKIVIAPQKWSNTPSARFENIVPETWIRV